MKNRTLLYFIAGSLVLLGLLEFLWLQKSYNEQRSYLQHLVQQSLRSAVAQESNAMMMGALRNNPTFDSLFQGGKLRLPFSPSFFRESQSSKSIVGKSKDSLRQQRSIQIIMDSSAQSRVEFRQIQLSTKQIQPLRGGGRNDIQIILGNDTAAFPPPFFPDNGRWQKAVIFLCGTSGSFCRTLAGCGRAAPTCQKPLRRRHLLP